MCLHVLQPLPYLLETSATDIRTSEGCKFNLHLIQFSYFFKLSNAVFETACTDCVTHL
jgi:hypothetical protein